MLCQILRSFGLKNHIATVHFYCQNKLKQAKHIAKLVQFQWSRGHWKEENRTNSAESSNLKKSKVDTCTRASGHLQIFSIWLHQSDLLCSPSTHTNFELIWTKIAHSYSSNLSLKSAETGITHRYICPFSARKTSLERGKQGQHSCAIKSQKIQSGHLHACKWPLTSFHTQSDIYTLYSAPANFELIWTKIAHS